MDSNLPCYSHFWRLLFLLPPTQSSLNQLIGRRTPILRTQASPSRSRWKSAPGAAIGRHLIRPHSSSRATPSGRFGEDDSSSSASSCAHRGRGHSPALTVPVTLTPTLHLARDWSTVVPVVMEGHAGQQDLAVMWRPGRTVAMPHIYLGWLERDAGRRDNF